MSVSEREAQVSHELSQIEAIEALELFEANNAHMISYRPPGGFNLEVNTGRSSQLPFTHTPRLSRDGGKEQDLNGFNPGSTFVGDASY